MRHKTFEPSRVEHVAHATRPRRIFQREEKKKKYAENDKNCRLSIVGRLKCIIGFIRIGHIYLYIKYWMSDEIIFTRWEEKKTHNNQSKEFELQVIITNNKIDWVGVSNICTKCTVTSRRPASFIMLINSRWLKIKSHLCGSHSCILSTFQNLFLSFLFDFWSLSIVTLLFFFWSFFFCVIKLIWFI